MTVQMEPTNESSGSPNNLSPKERERTTFGLTDLRQTRSTETKS